MKRSILLFRSICGFVVFAFLLQSIIPPQLAQAQVSPIREVNLQTMPTFGHSFTPTLIRGMKFNPGDGLNFNFIVDSGDANLQGDDLKKESEKLIKYFLTALAVPEKDLWVNLSPFEKDRITTDALGQTEMGQDLLAQDYLLKQLTASLLYPDGETGKKFWEKIYSQVYEQYGQTDIPVESLSKVWIMPDKAEIFAQGDTVLILESRLQIMMEGDYSALEQSQGHGVDPAQEKTMDQVKDVFRNVIIPTIKQEVNEGKNFSQLRQIYHSLILAKWFKENLKGSIINQAYSDRSKVKGIDKGDSNIIEQIYNQYIDAFKAGSEGYIREDYNPVTQEMIANKYVTGGFLSAGMNQAMLVNTNLREAFGRFLKIVQGHVLNSLGVTVRLFQEEEIWKGWSITDRAQLVSLLRILKDLLGVNAAPVPYIPSRLPFIASLFLIQPAVITALSKQLDGDPTIEDMIKFLNSNERITPALENIKRKNGVISIVGHGHAPTGLGDQIKGMLNLVLAPLKPGVNVYKKQLEDFLKTWADMVAIYRTDLELIDAWKKGSDSRSNIYVVEGPIKPVLFDAVPYYFLVRSLLKKYISEEQIENLFLLVLGPLYYRYVRNELGNSLVVAGEDKTLFQDPSANNLYNLDVSLIDLAQKKLISQDAALKVRAVLTYSAYHRKNYVKTRIADLKNLLPAAYQNKVDEISANLDSMYESVKKREAFISKRLTSLNVLYKRVLMTIGKDHLAELHKSVKSEEQVVLTDQLILEGLIDRFVYLDDRLKSVFEVYKMERQTGIRVAVADMDKQQILNDGEKALLEIEEGLNGIMDVKVKPAAESLLAKIPLYKAQIVKLRGMVDKAQMAKNISKNNKQQQVNTPLMTRQRFLFVLVVIIVVLLKPWKWIWGSKASVDVSGVKIDDTGDELLYQNDLTSQKSFFFGVTHVNTAMQYYIYIMKNYKINPTECRKKLAIAMELNKKPLAIAGEVIDRVENIIRSSGGKKIYLAIEWGPEVSHRDMLKTMIDYQKKWQTILEELGYSDAKEAADQIAMLESYPFALYQRGVVQASPGNVVIVGVDDSKLIQTSMTATDGRQQKTLIDQRNGIVANNIRRLIASGQVVYLAGGAHTSGVEAQLVANLNITTRYLLSEDLEGVLDMRIYDFNRDNKRDALLVQSEADPARIKEIKKRIVTRMGAMLKTMEYVQKHPSSFTAEFMQRINQGYLSILKEKETISADLAMFSSNINGGIDFQMDRMNLMQSGAGIDSAMLPVIQNINPDNVIGITIGEITITPIPSIYKLLGLNDPKEQENDESVPSKPYLKDLAFNRKKNV